MHFIIPGFKAVIFLVLTVMLQFSLAGPLHAEPNDPKLANKRCQMCHGKEGFGRGGRDLAVLPGEFDSSVHGSQDCVGCHTDITKVPHRKNVERKVGCVQCHLDEWSAAQVNGTAHENDKLANVVDHIESYMESMHARPRIDDKSRTNATCFNCHGSHDIQSVDRESRSQNFLGLTEKCGTCHADVLSAYRTSVHGQENAAGNTAAAICADCHTRHGVGEANTEEERVQIAENCGTCHEDSMKTYLATYHGKVLSLIHISEPTRRATISRMPSSA